MRRLRPFLGLLAIASPLTCGLAAPPVRAQTAATSNDSGFAQALFDDAKARMAANDFANACPKFAESYRLDPAAGTLVGLALCDEAEGRTASAWGEFLLLVKEAKKSGRADREQLARDHVAKLEPRLSRMTIVVADEAQAAPGLEVKRDGAVVATAVWRTAVPADPGVHVVEASAPGKSPWRTEIRLGPAADSVTVNVPPLSDADADSPAPTERPARDAAGGPDRGRRGARLPAAAVILGGAGIAAISVGGYFGVQALSEYGQAKSDCSLSACRDPASVAKSHDAVRDADVADVLIGAGIVALAAGIYLAVAARSPPREPPMRTVVLPYAGSGHAGLTLETAW